MIKLSDDEFDDEALAQLIQQKQEEAKCLEDLPLFDANIICEFIDEWFADLTLTVDSLELPIGMSVTFQGLVNEELTVAQKAVQQREKIHHEKTLLKANIYKFYANQIHGYQIMMKDLKDEFEKRCDAVKGALMCLEKKIEQMVQSHNAMLKRKALGQPTLDPKIIEHSKKASKSLDQQISPQPASRGIQFPTGFSGPRNPQPSTATSSKITKQDEVEAKKHKRSHPTEAQPSPPVTPLI